MLKMYLSSKPGILKVITLAVLIITTAVGVSAYYNSTAKARFDSDVGYRLCKITPDCPHEAKPLEIAFVWTNIAVLALILINLVVFIFLHKNANLIAMDIIFTTVAGILVVAAGSLFIYCAIMLDRFADGRFRKEMKYIDKIAAGALGIVDGILFLTTANAVRYFSNTSSAPAQGALYAPPAQPLPTGIQANQGQEYQQKQYQQQPVYSSSYFGGNNNPPQQLQPSTTYTIGNNAGGYQNKPYQFPGYYVPTPKNDGVGSEISIPRAKY